VLADAEAWKQAGDLERSRQAGGDPKVRRLGFDPLAAQRHAACVAGDRAGQDREQRALAGAVGADETDDLAGRNAQIDAVEHDVAGETLHDALAGEPVAAPRKRRPRGRRRARRRVGELRAGLKLAGDPRRDQQNRADEQDAEQQQIGIAHPGRQRVLAVGRRHRAEDRPEDRALAADRHPDQNLGRQHDPDPIRAHAAHQGRGEAAGQRADGGAQREGDHPFAKDRDAEMFGALAVEADRDETVAERPPKHGEPQPADDDRRYGEAEPIIDLGRGDGLDENAGAAAGHRPPAAGDLLGEQRDRQREHRHGRGIGRTAQSRRRDRRPQQRREHDPRRRARQRRTVAGHRDRDAVDAEAEEHRVADRDDAGAAPSQVEADREQPVGEAEREQADLELVEQEGAENRRRQQESAEKAAGPQKPGRGRAPVQHRAPMRARSYAGLLRRHRRSRLSTSSGRPGPRRDP
jgi:hypothetical protein